MTYFCPVCWTEIPAETAICPHCSADLRQADSRSFTEKLLSALHHREPETAVRAAWILGEKRERSAVPELVNILRTTSDSFLGEAAAEALGKIGDPRGLAPLRHAAEHGPPRVRISARSAIAKIGSAEL